MLTILILIPLFSSVIILLLNNSNTIKQASLISTFITIFFSIYIIFIIDTNTPAYSFVDTPISTPIFNLTLGIDGISIIFVILTTFTIPFCVLAIWSNITNIKDVKYFIIILLTFESFTIIVFLVLDLIAFYVSFEAVLIPLFIIIGIFGGDGKKRASFILFMYTLTGSLFILLGFSTLYYYTGTTNIVILSNIDFSDNISYFIWLSIFISFAVKTPLVPLHSWLQFAHVQAPVAGSIVLAGLTLKIASYGIIRILIPILPNATTYFTPLALTIGVISILYASFSALRQTDVKCLIAYSSVAHIGVVVLGIFSNTTTGIIGAIILSVAHGLVSPALFYIVGGIVYDRFHTRIIKYYRGLVIYIPLAITIFFIFTIANIGIPGTVNWIGEFISLTGTFNSSPIIGIIGASTILLSSCYSIWLYNRIAFGSFSHFTNFTTDLTRREINIIITLLIGTILLGLFPNYAISIINLSVSLLILP